MTKKLLNVNILFSAVVTLSFGYGVYETRYYDFLAKIFPLYVSLLLLVVALINMILEIKTALKGEKESNSGMGDLGTKWDIPMPVVWKRMSFYIGTILILYLGIWVIGYPLGITLYIVLFYRYVAKSRWIWSISAGLAGFGFLTLAYQVMHMDWPEGLIGMPWPLG